MLSSITRLALVLPLICGCATLKEIEGQVYDFTADGVSDYCNGLAGEPIATQERLELRREIRQRGDHGPAPVQLPYLDEQTSAGGGPVVIVYCEGEVVPEAVWRSFIRNRRSAF